MRQTIIFLFLNSLFVFSGYTQNLTSSDTLFVFDESERIVKKIYNKQIVEEIEYPESEPEVIADIETFLPFFLKSTDYVYDFIVGDTVLLEVFPIDQRIVGEVALLNSKGGLVVKAVKVKRAKHFSKQVIIRETDAYTLKIKSNFLFSGRIKVKVTRRPQIVPVSYRLVRDTIFYQEADSIISIDVEKRDTTLFQLLDYNTLIHNKLDLEHQSRKSIPILFPTEMVDSANYFFYWIGLTRSDTLQYLSLNNNFDFSTLKLESELTTPAIAAYGLGWKNSLPKTDNVNLRYSFTNLNNKTLFKQKKRVEKVIIGQIGVNPPNFGRVAMSVIRNLPTIEIEGILYKQLFLNVENYSKVNTYPIQLKMMAMGIQNTYKKTAIRRIKEIRTYKIKIE